jgi:CPA2 family monovalent cation:H+ antiporter-2
MVQPLELTLLYLLAAVAGVVICRLARLPPMLGYLAVGVVVGPHVLAIGGGESAGVSYLAEFGIVFLMFVIGLEFNLPKLQSMRRLVFGLGLSQVVLTILAARRQRALAWAFARRKAAWGSASKCHRLGSALAMARRRSSSSS